MSIAKKIALSAVVYIGYQLLTNKKYDGLRKEILSEYENAKPSLLSTLDDLHTYLVVPKDVNDETVRIRIDAEIENLKQKIKQIDAAKAAEKTNKIVTSVADNVSKSLSTLKKKK
jgi:hypothetical protein